MLDLKGTILMKTMISRVKLLKRPLTESLNLSTNVLSNSIASHTPMQARLQVLKLTLTLMLKAMVCFSAFKSHKLRRDTHKCVMSFTMLLLVECLDRITGYIVVQHSVRIIRSVVENSGGAKHLLFE